ncbi:serine/threonine protein kinase [Aphanomyces invadans]|uniref:Serine/threonine protein kinase n=1 Tax=Aphanomyces invadans TaxID=157072 RepID=A0A024UKS0_9STRA|nr:serine/threonine protein kinase [Aphanomyces invadans]ETW06228.1 serine/threonine protein kinase [Aphanomyces invadans]|eukprot:XP_008864303.1 serine/threonine protein kinase [Aphanomyces invadans]
MAADWEAIVDESGVPYYYNPITGETAWSIPADDGAVDEWPPVAARTDVEVATHSRPATASCGGGEWAFGGVNPDDGAFFFVHTATGERVANLPMSLAEAPTTPSTAHEDGAFSVDVDPAVLVCMEDVVQAIETTLAVWMRRRQRNAKALAKQRQRGNVATTHGTTVDATREVHGRQPRAAVRMHHVLANAKRYECTAEYESRRAAMAAQVREDEVEKETVRVKERFAQRRQHQQDQIQLRHHITRVLIAKATNGLDIHGKIDLTSGDDRRPPGQPLQREELFESEERAAVARQRKRQLEHLFVAIDTDKRGTMSTLHVLHELAIQPHVVQRWVQPPRRGVQDMLLTGVLQAFFLQLQRVNVRQFVDFVEISEDVVARVDRIKAAMEQAGLGVVSADVATWQSSMLNVKSGESAANRQVVFVRRMQLAFQAAKEACIAQLRHVLHFRHPGSVAPPSECPARKDSTTTAPPIWQLAHKHVYLQLTPYLPPYCVHCRRCRTRLDKLERFEAEESHRAKWGRYLARRMHDIEMSMRQWPTQATDDEADLASITPELAGARIQGAGSARRTSTRSRDDEAVAVTLHAIVTGAALLATYNAWEARVLAPPPHTTNTRNQPPETTPETALAPPATSVSKHSTHDLLNKLTKRREEVEREEMARAMMFDEDELIREGLESAKMTMELPLILEQEAAHREFVRLVQACVNPSMVLKRLNFERVLAIRSPTDNMVLRVVDSATNTHCVVHTIRCASVDEADHVVLVARQLQHHRPPHTLHVLHVFQYTYQQFANNGNLNECWPIVFVVTEDCMEGGHWLPPSPRPPLPTADVLHILHAVSAALAALHSQSICHWNLNARNLYRSSDVTRGGDARDRRQQLRLGGFLVFKQPFRHDDVSKGPLHPSLAPPEVSTARNGAAVLNEKTDMWMLGCLLYSLLTGVHWKVDIGRSTCRVVGSDVVVREKDLSTIMTDIPLRYGPSLRSCLRMLLQPQPQHRPTAMEMFNFISCASPDEGATADPNAHPPLTIKKSAPSLDPLPPR